MFERFSYVPTPLFGFTYLPPAFLFVWRNMPMPTRYIYPVMTIDQSRFEPPPTLNTPYPFWSVFWLRNRMGAVPKLTHLLFSCHIEYIAPPIVVSRAFLQDRCAPEQL